LLHDHALADAAPARAAPDLLAAEAVRAYDIRGVAGRQVTAPGVQALGLNYATQARAGGLSKIGVGRDGRLSSARLERALVRGLVEGGMTVDRIGVCPTPKLGFAVRQLGLDGAIMVTASHNPAPENGLKLMLGRERIHGDALKALVAAAGRPAPGGREREAQVEDAYLQALLGAATGMAPLKVAWDCGNGATGAVVAELARRLPGRHVLINTEIDGRFPNHHADPAVPANLAQLQAMVRARGCDLGIAFDGDGDRIGVVDGTGAPMAADHLLLFLARDLLQRRPGAAVVGDVKSSRLLFDGVAAAGGRPVMAPSGYVLVRQVMQRHGALLAGELSGHIFFADEWDGPDDALYAAVRLLRILSGGGQSLAQFRRGLPQAHATPEMRLACPNAQALVRALARSMPQTPFDPAMGLRRASEDGWWLIRASGTEPKITCRCESDTAEGLQRLIAGLAERLGAHGVDAVWPAEF
jgi:phosphomannomutase